MSEIMIDDYGVLKVENTSTGSFDYPIYVDGVVYFERPEIWSEDFKSKVQRGLSRKSEKRLASSPLQYSKYKSGTPEPKTSVELDTESKLEEDLEVESRVPAHLR